jgi:hypothetical protein
VFARFGRLHHDFSARFAFSRGAGLPTVDGEELRFSTVRTGVSIAYLEWRLKQSRSITFWKIRVIGFHEETPKRVLAGKTVTIQDDFQVAQRELAVSRRAHVGAEVCKTAECSLPAATDTLPPSPEQFGELDVASDGLIEHIQVVANAFDRAFLKKPVSAGIHEYLLWYEVVVKSEHAHLMIETHVSTRYSFS